MAPAVTVVVAADTEGADATHEAPPVPAGAAVTAADGDVADALAAAPAATPATDDPAHGCAGVGIVPVVGGGGVVGAGDGVAGADVAGGVAGMVESAADGALVLPGVALVPVAGGVAADEDASVA